MPFNGQAWFLGEMVVKGSTICRVTQDRTILHCKDAIEPNIAKSVGQMVTLSGRETYCEETAGDRPHPDSTLGVGGQRWKTAEARSPRPHPADRITHRGPCA
jgi:hypothetical protein